MFCSYYSYYKVLNIIQVAVAQRCSVKNIFLEISQNSQENTCSWVSFLIKLQALVCIFPYSDWIRKDTSKNTFSYRTSPVAASVQSFNSTWETSYPQIYKTFHPWFYLHFVDFFWGRTFYKVLWCFRTFFQELLKLQSFEWLNCVST